MSAEIYDLSLDHPVQNPSEDRLGFFPFAKAIASIVTNHIQGESLVIGLNGKWGTGKSTILNFIQQILNDSSGNNIRVVRFNPWYFSGRENLAGLLLSEISAEIEPNKKGAVRNAIADLIDVANGLSLGVVNLNFKAFTDRLRSPTSLYKIKQEVDSLLSKKKIPILVMIDDIDRLVADEIRDIFRAVKAVASLPYVSYLMAFDSDVVIDALNENEKEHGAEYLEKIVQVQFPVPAIDQYELRTILFAKLDSIIELTKTPAPDNQEWGNVYFSAVESLIKTPRAVNRVVNMFSATYPVVAGEVLFIDFFCIECIRAFEPALYELIKINGNFLTNSVSTDAEKAKRRETIESWISGVNLNRREAIRYLLFYLFPAIADYFGNTFAMIRYSRPIREVPAIGNEDFFPIYFRFAIDSDSIPIETIKRIIHSASDKAEFVKNLLPLTKSKRRDGTTTARLFLERMMMLADTEIPNNHIENILMALFDIGDELNVEQDSGKGSLDFGNDMRISRIARKLLKRIDISERCRILKAAISEGRSVSVASEMMVTIAWQYGEMTSHPADRIEDRLIDSNAYSELKEIVAEKIAEKARGKQLFDIIGFPHLLWVWEAWCRDKEEMKSLVKTAILHEDQLVAFLCGFVGTSRSWSMGDVVPKERRVMQFDSISRYAVLDAIKQKLSTIENKTLNEREEEAVRLFTSQYGKPDD